jgi:peptidoglycan L-alanyl-D-glutamate endopeptidase CwlK
MASRDLDDLQPAFRAKAYTFQMRCDELGFPVLCYCTLRTHAEQAKLYRQSRVIGQIRDKADELRREYGRPDLAEILMAAGPQYGPHVTTAAPGQSLHTYGLAVDGVPLVGGKPMWRRELPEEASCWLRYGEIGEACGLEWSGRWTSFPEFPHFQEPTADWRALIRSSQHSLT